MPPQIVECASVFIFVPCLHFAFRFLVHNYEWKTQKSRCVNISKSVELHLSTHRMASMGVAYDTAPPTQQETQIIITLMFTFDMPWLFTMRRQDSPLLTPTFSTICSRFFIFLSCPDIPYLSCHMIFSSSNSHIFDSSTQTTSRLHHK